MQPGNLVHYLKQSPYPGRGILFGLAPNKTTGIIAYFIMGRSENSRNRVFLTEGEGIRTSAFDSGKMKDPSLIIYSPVKVSGNLTIVTNGDQTDTVYDILKSGGTFEAALNTRTFEPDAPNYTPRISGLYIQEENKAAYQLSILKSRNGDPSICLREFFNYEQALPGVGHMIHTYQSDRDPLLSFEGSPLSFTMEKEWTDPDQIGVAMWESLNSSNKVSLFVRTIDLVSGSTDTRIFNINSDEM